MKSFITGKIFLKVFSCAALVMALLPLSLVMADETPLAACAGDNVAGTVVDVNEDSGVVTIDTGEDGLCTVTIAAGDYDHPIVSLLGRYFDNVSVDDVAEALAATEVWVVCDEDGECTLAEEGDEGAVQGRVTGVTENEDGTFTLEIETEGDSLEVSMEDDDLAGDLGDALDALGVDWELGEGEDGPVVLDAGDKIAELHDDGMGFGVIVKLYGIAAASQANCDAEAEGEDSEAEDPADEGDELEACGVTVDELAEAVQGGTGLGQLFKQYGKPALLGVGHVRKAAQAEAEAADDETETEAEAETEALDVTANGCKDKKNGKPQGNPHCVAEAPALTGPETSTDVAPTGPGNSGNTGGNGNGGGNGGGNNGNGGGNGGNNGNGGNGGGNGGGHGRP